MNAIVHKDYRIQEPVTVAIYPDRLEVSSIGTLPKGWSPDDLLKEHKSIRRNRSLANIFHDAGYVEKWGQGIERVVEACKANGNPLPEFSIVTGAVVATIPVRKSKADVFSSVGTSLKGLNREIINRMSGNPRITRVILASELGVSESTISHTYPIL